MSRTVGRERSEPELVVAAQAGDGEAFGHLLTLYRPMLEGLCGWLTNSQSDLDDAFQETSLRAWQQVHTYDGRAKFSTWLYRVAYNAIVDMHRHQTRAKRRARPLVERSANDFADAVVARVALADALATLSIEDRTAVVLHEWAELGYDEIGQILHLSRDGAKSRVTRAIKQKLGPLLLDRSL